MIYNEKELRWCQKLLAAHFDFCDAGRCLSQDKKRERRYCVQMARIALVAFRKATSRLESGRYSTQKEYENNLRAGM